jgi:hypothetical protein
MQKQLVKEGEQQRAGQNSQLNLLWHGFFREERENVGGISLLEYIFDY